jgi:hypothetical protein
MCGGVRALWSFHSGFQFEFDFQLFTISSYVRLSSICVSRDHLQFVVSRLNFAQSFSYVMARFAVRDGFDPLS